MYWKNFYQQPRTPMEKENLQIIEVNDTPLLDHNGEHNFVRKSLRNLYSLFSSFLSRVKELAEKFKELQNEFSENTKVRRKEIEKLERIETYISEKKKEKTKVQPLPKVYQTSELLTSGINYFPDLNIKP